jgi:hypothetical protein
MPAQRTTRTTTKPAAAPGGGKATSTRATATANSKARNGNKAIEFVQMTVAAEVYLTGGEDKGFDLTVCSKCAALLPDSTNSKKLHLSFHESVYRLEQATS